MQIVIRFGFMKVNRILAVGLCILVLETLSMRAYCDTSVNNDGVQIQVISGNPMKLAVQAPTDVIRILAGGNNLRKDADGIWYGEFEAASNSAFPVQSRLSIKLFTLNDTVILKDVFYDLPSYRLTRKEQEEKEMIEAIVQDIRDQTKTAIQAQIPTASYEVYTKLTRRNYLLKLRNTLVAKSGYATRQSSDDVLTRLENFRQRWMSDPCPETTALELEALDLRNHRLDFDIGGNRDFPAAQKEADYMLRTATNLPLKLRLLVYYIARLEAQVDVYYAMQSRSRLISEVQSINRKKAESEVEKNSLDSQKQTIEILIADLTDNLKKKIDAGSDDTQLSEEQVRHSTPENSAIDRP